MKSRHALLAAAAGLFLLFFAVSTISAGIVADFHTFLPLAVKAGQPPTPTAAPTMMTPVVPTVTPTPTGGPTVQPTPSTPSAPGACTICSDDLSHCGDFSAQAQAGPDGRRLNSAGAGDACANLP